MIRFLSCLILLICILHSILLTTFVFAFDTNIDEQIPITARENLNSKRYFFPSEMTVDELKANGFILSIDFASKVEEIQSPPLKTFISKYITDYVVKNKFLNSNTFSPLNIENFCILPGTEISPDCFRSTEYKSDKLIEVIFIDKFMFINLYFLQNEQYLQTENLEKIYKKLLINNFNLSVFFPHLADAEVHIRNFDSFDTVVQIPKYPTPLDTKYKSKDVKLIYRFPFCWQESIVMAIDKKRKWVSFRVSMYLSPYTEDIGGLFSVPGMIVTPRMKSGWFTKIAHGRK